MTKLKILVPTDYSDLSAVAARFAADIAVETNSELGLIHVMHTDERQVSSSLRASMIEKAVMENLERESAAFLDQLHSIYPSLSLHHEIIRGYPLDRVVEHYAKKHGYDLVLIGTKGASGLKKMLFGSNAATIVAHSSLPVIVVPGKAVFRGLNHIVYASTLDEADGEIGVILALARVFNSQVHILHLVAGGASSGISTEAIKTRLKALYPGGAVSVDIRESEDFTETLNRYLLEKKADLLAMFTHEPGTYEKIFGKSFTREMAFHTWIPLLSMKTR